MKSHIATALISAIITFVLTSFLGVVAMDNPASVDTESMNTAVPDEQTEPACGIPLTSSVSAEDLAAWETISDIAGITLNVPKDYGWRAEKNPKTGMIETVRISKDNSTDAPYMALIKTSALNNIDKETEQVIAVQPLELKTGEGKKVTIQYYDTSIERHVVSTYYLFAYNGNTYRFTLYNNKHWQLFDDIAKTVSFEEPSTT